MSPITINAEGLWSEALKYLSPHHPENIEGVQAAFAQQTDKKHLGGARFSGYRFRALERYGLEESKALAHQLRQNFETMLVLGIGGSALGARTAINALSWNVSPAERRRVLIADNLDPIEFEELWSQCQLSKTVVVVISKSGATIETMTQTSTVIERLNVAGLSLQKHLVTITDPTNGALREWTASMGLSSLSVPSDVGGRFSVLTPVGLLPIAFSGISVDEILEGAAGFFKQNFIDSQMVARIGLRFAELENSGFVAHSLMPYSTKLKDFGSWFVQLWGESLGKIKEGRGDFGMIPIAAVGATDQHSLLQLLVEGPNRIVNGFIRIQNWPQTGNKRPSMAKLPAEFANLSFAFGKTFEEILNAEAIATRTVLEQKQRPTYEITLIDHGPHAFGALVAFYMDLVSHTGAALEINPYDQPGVEFGKKILPTLLRA